jgi:hypothetical protein
MLTLVTGPDKIPCNEVARENYYNKKNVGVDPSMIPNAKSF